MAADTKDEALRVAREALERAESAMNYTRATVSPGNQRDRKGEWVEVHGGRAESSYRQLQLAIGATRSALRTIALAVEGSADGGSSQEASTCPHGVPHRWPCDQCDAAFLPATSNDQQEKQR